MPKRPRARKQTISIDGTYRVTCCEDGHIHVWLSRPGTKPFELIADTEEKMCHMFGVVKNKIMYGKKVKGIERSTFLIGPDGVLREEWRGLKVVGHVDEVLKAVKALKKANGKPAEKAAEAVAEKPAKKVAEVAQ